MRFTGLFEDVRTIQKAQVIGAQRTFFCTFLDMYAFYSHHAFFEGVATSHYANTHAHVHSCTRHLQAQFQLLSTQKDAQSL